MGFKCGIVGLPNVGKSTLFNAITSGSARVANYPFTTIEPQTGIVDIPDSRLKILGGILKPPKIIPTTIEFVDIAGLVKNASRGEGLGNQFLAHIREVDAVVHVVRCFKNEDIVHVNNRIDPKDDIEIISVELLLKDLETVEKKLNETGKKAKSGEKKLLKEIDFYLNLKDFIARGKIPDTSRYDEDEKRLFSELHLLSNKPVLYVANVDKEGLTHGNEYLKALAEVTKQNKGKIIVVDAQMEAEIANMPYQEREDFLKDLGLSQSGLDQVIHEGYTILNLITFFTHNEKELRAWTIKQGTKAPQAAGKIHSDFERGFIKAEVIEYKDISNLKSEHAVKERGLLGIHGHDYVIKDGDLVLFRFNV